MPRGVFENRYLRFYRGGVQVRIVRLKVNYSRKFNYRTHGGKDLAVQKARRHRDRAYKEIFGVNLMESSHLLAPRSGSDYPVGISSIKNDSGEIVAFIASWQIGNGKTHREYVGLSEYGGSVEESLNIAVKMRMKAVLGEDTES